MLLLMYLVFSFMAHIVANAGHFRFEYPYEWILCLAGAVALDRGPPRSPGRRVVAGLIVALIAVSQLAIHDVWTDAFR